MYNTYSSQRPKLQAVYNDRIDSYMKVSLFCVFQTCMSFLRELLRSYLRNDYVTYGRCVLLVLKSINPIYVLSFN